MALKILIDDFEGDPEELYGLVREEVQRRQIPGVEFKSAFEFRVPGWFRRSEVVQGLAIADEDHRVLLLGYQFGRSFHVSTRAYWNKTKLALKEREGKLMFLEEVRSGCFSETVDRAVRVALTRHLEKRQAPVPASLNPCEVFYSREAQTAEAEG